ncbi:hypothetical protein CKY51_09140 [Xanthomonas maliensis]|nr:hypothetical protein CKY51_09140 [Xanthomonas maliensis]
MIAASVSRCGGMPQPSLHKDGPIPGAIPAKGINSGRITGLCSEDSAGPARGADAPAIAAHLR